jgi:hypothetical protein
MDKITLISNTESFYRWESDWISWLLSDFDVEHVCDPTLTAMHDNVVLVISGDIRGQGEQIESYIKALKSKGGEVGLIHLSDEWSTYPVNFYKDAVFVFRSYYRDGVIDGIHCRYLPLGAPNGKAKSGTQKPPSQRTHRWSFMGELKSTRVQMIHAADRIPGGFKHLTHKWEDQNALSPAVYGEAMSETIFSLCPRGNNTPDTFRMYEALEAGRFRSWRTRAAGGPGPRSCGRRAFCG